MLGTTWQVITNGVQADTASPPVKAIIPKEGSTAWSDSWMVYSKTKHPNCAYKWLNWITKPDVQAQVAEYFGEAPANLEACAKTTDPSYCTTYHADDQAFYDQLSYWTTPTKKCLDGRTERRMRRRTRTGRRRGTRSRAAEPERRPSRRPSRAGSDLGPPLGDRADAPSLRRACGRARARPGCDSASSCRVPLTWLLVVYIGSLAALDRHVAVPPRRTTRPGCITDSTPRSGSRTSGGSGTRRCTARSRCGPCGAAVTVTVIDALRRAARSRSTWRRSRRPGPGASLVVAVTMPLWAGYLVKGYAWRAILDPGGGVARRRCSGTRPASGTTSVDHRALVPVVPVHGDPDLRRARPAPELAARGVDRSRRQGGSHVRSVVLPQVCPALVAGSIFTFSLTLGDFYMNRIVGGTTEFIGNVVYRQFSVDLPFAAAYSTVPIVIMVVYLLAVRRTGALEEL